jgi:hypothetical protein
MEKDRRKAPRAVSHIPIDLYDLKGRAVTGEGQFVNFSMTGAMLETPKPLKLKEKIRLRYQPGKEAILDVAGKVVWAVKKRRLFQYGLQFDPRLRSALATALRA